MLINLITEISFLKIYTLFYRQEWLKTNERLYNSKTKFSLPLKITHSKQKRRSVFETFPGAHSGKERLTFTQHKRSN